MFEEAHSLGMFTVLWCYLRNPAFKTNTERVKRREEVDAIVRTAAGRSAFVPPAIAQQIEEHVPQLRAV